MKEKEFDDYLLEFLEYLERGTKKESKLKEKFQNEYQDILTYLQELPRKIDMRGADDYGISINPAGRDLIRDLRQKKFIENQIKFNKVLAIATSMLVFVGLSQAAGSILNTPKELRVVGAIAHIMMILIAGAFVMWLLKDIDKKG